MKIILEETAENLKGKRRVEIELEWDQDDMNIYEFREKLLEPALLAWTYHPSTIAELFGEHSEELSEWPYGETKQKNKGEWLWILM